MCAHVHAWMHFCAYVCERRGRGVEKEEERHQVPPLPHGWRWNGSLNKGSSAGHGREQHWGKASAQEGRGVTTFFSMGWVTGQVSGLHSLRASSAEPGRSI